MHRRQNHTPRPTLVNRYPYPPGSTESDGILTYLKQVTQYIAQHVVPNMRRFLMDNDKALASCINMVYYIVSPSLKGKARSATDKPFDLHRNFN